MTIELIPVVDIWPQGYSDEIPARLPETGTEWDALWRRCLAGAGVHLAPLRTGTFLVELGGVLACPRRARILEVEGRLADARALADVAPLAGGFALRVDGIVRLEPEAGSTLADIAAWLGWLERPTPGWRAAAIGYRDACLRLRDGDVDISTVTEAAPHRQRFIVELGALREAALQARLALERAVEPVRYALRHWTAFETQIVARQLLGISRAGQP